MSTFESEKTDNCRESAMNWLIRLREEPESAERAEAFEIWLSEHPGNRAAWAEVQEVWSLVGEVGERPNTTAGNVTEFPRKNRRPGRLLAGLAIAASVFLAVFTLPDLLVRFDGDIVTGTGETAQATLPDGSTIHLAAQSAVKVDYSNENRRIRLLKGAVFAEVEPDPARPFSILSDKVESTALGTAYEVRRETAGSTVAVEHGIVGVSFTDAGLRHKLHAAQWLRVTQDGGRTVKGVMTTGAVASWRNGRLSVDDRPLKDVIDQLDDYFDGTVMTLGSLDDYRVTGVYNLESPESALRAALYPHGLKLRKLSPWLLVISSL